MVSRILIIALALKYTFLTVNPSRDALLEPTTGDGVRRHWRERVLQMRVSSAKIAMRFILGRHPRHVHHRSTWFLSRAIKIVG